MLKPSAPPWVNQDSMWSAICSGGAGDDVAHQAQGEAADGEVLAAGEADEAFGGALRLVGVRDVGHGAVDRVVAEVHAEEVLEGAQRDVVGDELLELVQALLGLGLGGGDDRGEGRPDEDLGGVAAVGGDAGLEVGVEVLGVGEAVVAGEDDLGVPGGEFAADG
ncbi:hypothetical protein GCM10020000_76550 [Streptomyces olivoverticillatus]